MLYCIVLYCVVLYCIVLYYIVLYRIVLYCIALYCIVSYRIVLYCIVLYCIVLYCNIVEAPISDSAYKTASCLNDWRNKGNQILHRRPSVSRTVCPVRMQGTWCYYMVLLLHGAIKFFVISCSANIIYKPFLNWRIWEMSKDGKHHFHLKEYSILQLLYA